MRVSVIVGALMLGASMLNPLHVAYAQSTPKIPRIGFLTSTPAGSLLFETFRQALRERGYVEGKDILIEERHADDNVERLTELADDLVRLKVDVIVSSGTAPSLSAQQATKTIPIVMSGGGDPIAAGLVSNLARPGGNITGIAAMSGDLGRKRLELLKEINPNASLVAVLWAPDDSGYKLQMAELQDAARALRLRLLPVAVHRPNSFDSTFSEIKISGADSLIVLSGIAGAPNDRASIAELAAKSRLPGMYAGSSFVDAGGLVSYGPILVDVHRRAALYVDRILKQGAKPAEMPVENPTKFELVINLKAARQIGLQIPESVLQRADRIVN